MELVGVSRIMFASDAYPTLVACLLCFLVVEFFQVGSGRVMAVLLSGVFVCCGFFGDGPGFIV